MQGHTYRTRKPDGSWSRWHAVIDLPTGPDGQRRQKTTTHDTRRDAQAWLAQTVQELRAGEVYDSTQTVAQFLTSWLDGKQALAPSTRLDYDRHIRQVFIPRLGQLRLLDLRAHHIEAVFQHLLDGNHRRERPIGPTTMRRVLATLTSALNTALRRGLIRRNPATTVELPRPNPTKARAWSIQEAATFLDGITDDPLHVLYRLLVLTGLRRGEAVGLQWGDLDLPAGTLTVNRQVVSVNGQPITGPPKSEAGRRTIALDSPTLGLLRLQERRAHLANPWEADQDFESRLLFTHPRGEAVHPTYVSRHFLTLIKGQRLRRVRLHDLRHTSASLGLAGGESLLEVSRRLGHSSLAITADVYSHITSATAKDSAERLAQALGAS